MGYLFAAMAVAWGTLFLYLAYLGQRQAQLSRELTLLQQATRDSAKKED